MQRHLRKQSKVILVTKDKGKCVFPARRTMPRKEASANPGCPMVYHYADLKKYIKNKEKKSSKNKKSFVEVTSNDSKEKYEVCNYAHFSELSKDDINKIIGFNGKSFSSKGKTNLARARRLYSSIANVNETSKGQYMTTPEMADIFLRYTTAAGLSSKSYGTEMFSKNGTKEGL